MLLKILLCGGHQADHPSLCILGVDHIITLDLHDPQFQGFFDCPVENLTTKSIITKYIQQHIPDHEEAVIVSPDAGGAKRYVIQGKAKQ